MMKENSPIWARPTKPQHGHQQHFVALEPGHVVEQSGHEDQPGNNEDPEKRAELRQRHADVRGREGAGGRELPQQHSAAVN